MKHQEDNRVVLVLGDYITDQWIPVHPKGQLSQPTDKAAYTLGAPETKIEGDVFSTPGGAGNVVRNLQEFGVNVALLSGEETSIKSRLIGPEKEVLFRVDQDVHALPISAFEINGVLKLLNLAGENLWAVVVADYVKGAIGRDVFEFLYSVADQAQIYVDTKRNPLQFPEKAVFTPNMSEYSRFAQEYGRLRYVVTKDGERGCVLDRFSMKPIRPTNTIEVKCSIGAGDSFLAALVAAELAGEPLERAVKFAVESATFACSKPLVSVGFGAEELEKFKTMEIV